MNNKNNFIYHISYLAIDAVFIVPFSLLLSLS